LLFSLRGAQYHSPEDDIGTRLDKFDKLVALLQFLCQNERFRKDLSVPTGYAVPSWRTNSHIISLKYDFNLRLSNHLRRRTLPQEVQARCGLCGQKKRITPQSEGTECPMR
jgi:hypothetical protein